MDGPTFHDLYERHATDVFRFARYLVRDEDAAADITAETFFRAWAGREAIRVGTAKAYLLTIARNLATDEHRRRRRFEGLGDDEAAARSGTSRAGRREPHTESHADASLALREALDAMATLPAGYREALALAASGVGYQEAADILGVPVSTLKIRVHRARLKLAGMLSQ